MPLPLDNIRILDFTRVLAGPFCTMMLADFGADVVKIERPHVGDDTRQWGPPWAGDHSAYYLSVNRNKRSLTLDLKQPAAQQVARDLAACADVVVENFKVGGMAEYGLDYPVLREINPRLIYCSITGYGQNGPYAAWPGYDFVIQAMSGLMSITGESGSEPIKTGVAISDIITGMYAANSIQAALFHVARTGEGQYIDISLYESQIGALVNVMSSFLVSGQRPARYGNAHANIVPYQLFHSSDQDFILAVGNDSQFAALCDVLARPELALDIRFTTNPQRVAHRADLVAILEPLFAAQPSAYWVEKLLSRGIPAGPINDLPTVVTDPHILERGLIQPTTMADGTTFNMVGPVPHFSATPAEIRRPPPLLGQHTDEVLAGWLNLSSDQISALRAQRLL